MATLTVKNLGTVGDLDIDTTLTAAASGGDQFTYTPRTALIVKNGSGGSITVTVTAQQTSTTKSGYGDVTKANFTATIAAGDYFISPFFEQALKDTNGFVQVTYSSHTSVEVGAFKFDELTTR